MIRDIWTKLKIIIFFKRYSAFVPLFKPFSKLRIGINIFKVLIFLATFILLPLPLTFGNYIDYNAFLMYCQSKLFHLFPIGIIFDIIFKLHCSLALNGEFIANRKIIFRKYFKWEFKVDLLIFFTFIVFLFNPESYYFLLLTFYFKIPEFFRIIKEIENNF